MKSFMDYENLWDFIRDFPRLDKRQMYLGLAMGATSLEQSHGFDCSCVSCSEYASLRLTTLAVSCRSLTPSAYQ